MYRIVQRITDFLVMRYINVRFTYLLTYKFLILSSFCPHANNGHVLKQCASLKCPVLNSNCDPYAKYQYPVHYTITVND